LSKHRRVRSRTVLWISNSVQREGEMKVLSETKVTGAGSGMRRVALKLKSPEKRGGFRGLWKQGEEVLEGVAFPLWGVTLSRLSGYGGNVRGSEKHPSNCPATVGGEDVRYELTRGKKRNRRTINKVLERQKPRKRVVTLI